MELTLEQKRAIAVAEARRKAEEDQSWSGTILPFSSDAEGNVSFDMDAGLPGFAKRVFTGPGDALTGKMQVTDPETGHITDDAVQWGWDTATVATPVNPAVRAGDTWAATGPSRSVMRRNVKTPTTKALKEAGAADIKAARKMALDIKPEAIGRHSQIVQQELYKKGIHPVDAPATFAKLKELENAPPGGFFTPDNLQALRESFGATAQNFNPAASKDQLAASLAIQRIDDFLPSLTQKDVVAGTVATARKAGETFKRGQGNYAAAKRANSLTGELDKAYTGIVEQAELGAQAANSGRNLDNALRQKVVSILKKPKAVSGFSDDELAVLAAFVEGGTGRNLARDASNMLGGGGGLGGTVAGTVGGGAGFAAGGIPGMVVGGATVGGAGRGLKGVQNMLAKREINKIADLVRQRSPLYQQIMQGTPMQMINPAVRAAPVRGAMIAGPHANPNTDPIVQLLMGL